MSISESDSREGFQDFNNSSNNSFMNTLKSSKLKVLKILKSVNCQLLNSTYQSTRDNFVFCSCDPEKKEPICTECARVCHAGLVFGWVSWII